MVYRALGFDPSPFPFNGTSCRYQGWLDAWLEELHDLACKAAAAAGVQRALDATAFLLFPSQRLGACGDVVFWTLEVSLVSRLGLVGCFWTH